jgi:quercetin dioxygenase-like cupin family protein
MITVGALGVRFLIEAADSDGTASVFECYVPANASMPAPHGHDGFEETVYGLEGVTTWTIDGETIEVGPGEAVCVPRGQIHGFENHRSVDATFLTIATPGVFATRLLPRDRLRSRCKTATSTTWPGLATLTLRGSSGADSRSNWDRAPCFATARASRRRRSATCLARNPSQSKTLAAGMSTG